VYEVTKIFMSKPANIWESLLRESSKRGRLPEGSVLILGHAGCGKSHLVAKLCSTVTGPHGNNSSNAVGGSGVESNIETTSAATEPISDVIAYDSFVAGDSEEVI
jgi:energy-coupling factor transporter ATP-binding protein EcfA2